MNETNEQQSHMNETKEQQSHMNESDESIDSLAEIIIVDMKQLDADQPKRPSAEEKKRFIDEQKNKHTVKKTKLDIQTFQTFLKEVNEEREVENIPADKLNDYLEDFIMTIRRKDSSDYEPGSLRSIFNSIARYLQQKKYAECLLKSAVFQGSREMLASKFKVRF